MDGRGRNRWRTVGGPMRHRALFLPPLLQDREAKTTMKQLSLALALVFLTGCATSRPVTGALAQVRVAPQNSSALRIDSANLLTIDEKIVVSGWVRGRSTGVSPTSHLDVVILNAANLEVGRQSAPIRLRHRRHGAPYPDRFAVAFEQWPADAVEVIVTLHQGEKHDSSDEN